MRRERNTKRKRGSREDQPRVSKISTPEKKTNKRKLADQKESTVGSRRRKRSEKKETNAATKRRQRAEKNNSDRNTTRRRRSEKNDSNRNTTRRRRQDIHTSHSSNRLMMVVLSVVVVAVTGLGLQFAFSSQRNIVRLEDQDHRDNQDTPRIAENNDTSQQQKSNASNNNASNVDNAPPKIPPKSFYDNPNRNTQNNPVPYTPPRIQSQQKQAAAPEENTQEDKSSDDLTPAENVLAEIDDSTEQQSDHREQYVQKMQEQGFVAFNGLWVQEKALDYHKSIA